MLVNKITIVIIKLKKLKIGNWIWLSVKVKLVIKYFKPTDKDDCNNIILAINKLGKIAAKLAKQKVINKPNFGFNLNKPFKASKESELTEELFSWCQLSSLIKATKKTKLTTI